MTAKPRPQLQPGETRAYPVLPLRDIVVFPHMIVPLFVGREKSIKALEEVMRSDTFILLATQKNASDDDPAIDSIFEVGTLASVLQLLKLPDGTVKVLVEGAERAKVLKYTDRSDYLRGRCHRSRRRHGRASGGGSDGAFGGHRIRKLCEAQQEGVARSGRCGPADRGLRQARRHRGLASRRQDSRQAGNPGDARRHPAPGKGAWPDGERNLRAAGGKAHPHPRQAADGEDAARVLPQRTDEGDPEGAGRRGRQGRTRRTRGEDQEDQALQGSPREGHARAQEAAPDVADVGGSHRRAQLSRLAALDPVEQEEQGQEGSRRARRRFSTPITMAWRRSRNASSSTSPCSSAPTS